MSREKAWFLAPALLTLLGVVLLPLAYNLWLSLHTYPLILGGMRFAGLANYIALLQDARFWNALFNTAYFTAVSVALELLLGLAVALLLHRSFPGRGVMRAVVLIPWAIPTVVSARMWAWMYHPDYGVINHLLGTAVNWLGSPLLAMHAAIAMEVWKTTPFVALLLTAGLQNIPRELYQAARLDGASPWLIFRRITLPLLMPLMLVTLLFRTIDAFRVFDAIYVLTGGGPADSTETLSIYAYKVLFQTLRFGYGSAIGMVVFLCAGGIALLYVRLLARSQR